MAVRPLDGPALYRFKKEFRIASEMAHPSVIRLYDLVASDEECFIMALVLTIARKRGIPVKITGVHDRHLHPPRAGHSPDRVSIVLGG